MSLHNAPCSHISCRLTFYLWVGNIVFAFYLLCFFAFISTLCRAATAFSMPRHIFAGGKRWLTMPSSIHAILYTGQRCGLASLPAIQ